MLPITEELLELALLEFSEVGRVIYMAMCFQSLRRLRRHIDQDIHELQLRVRAITNSAMGCARRELPARACKIHRTEFALSHGIGRLEQTCSKYS
jgi:hypothetical protein